MVIFYQKFKQSKKFLILAQSFQLLLVEIEWIFICLFNFIANSIFNFCSFLNLKFDNYYISIIFEINMKTLCAVLITLSLAAYPTNTSFLNLEYFLEPIIRPQVTTFGSTIYHDKLRNSDYLKPFDEREKSKHLLSNGQF